MSGVLETYAGAVAARTQKAGWIEVVLPVVLPVVVELITKCFDKSSELKSFAEGQRSALQLAGLRIRCNRAAREAGIDGFRRVQKAGTALMTSHSSMNWTTGPICSPAPNRTSTPKRWPKRSPSPKQTLRAVPRLPA